MRHLVFPMHDTAYVGRIVMPRRRGIAREGSDKVHSELIEVSVGGKK